MAGTVVTSMTLVSPARAPLVYLDGAKLMRVGSRGGGASDPEAPVAVAEGIERPGRGVAVDGRLLARTGLTGSPPSVTLEWFDDLRARLESSRPLPRSFR